jgi:hypothetical protein
VIQIKCPYIVHASSFTTSINICSLWVWHSWKLPSFVTCGGWKLISSVSFRQLQRITVSCTSHFTVFFFQLDVRTSWVVVTWNVSDWSESDFALRYQISECAVRNRFRYLGKRFHINVVPGYLSDPCSFRDACWVFRFIYANGVRLCLWGRGHKCAYCSSPGWYMSMEPRWNDTNVGRAKNSLREKTLFHWSRGRSVSIVSDYGQDDRTVEVPSPAETRGFFL